MSRPQAHLHGNFQLSHRQEKADEERSSGVVEERAGEHARQKLITQEQQLDCQAIHSHSNNKWREGEKEVWKYRKKKKSTEILWVKTMFLRV